MQILRIEKNDEKRKGNLFGNDLFTVKLEFCPSVDKNNNNYNNAGSMIFSFLINDKIFNQCCHSFDTSYDCFRMSDFEYQKWNFFIKYDCLK